MFLTLLKTSLLCGFLSIGASSNDRAPIDKGISTNINESVIYDNNQLDYIQVYNTDVESFCNDYVFTSMTLSYLNPQPFIEIERSGVYDSFNITIFSETGSYLRFYASPTMYVHVGEHNSNFGIYLVSNNNYTSFNSIRIYYDSSYNSDYNVEISRIVQYFSSIANPIDISVNQINKLQFINVANLLNDYGHNIDSYIFMSIHDVINDDSYQYYSNRGDWIFEDGYVSIGLDNPYIKGLFIYNDIPNSFWFDVSFHIANGTLRDSFVQALNNDIDNWVVYTGGAFTFTFGEQFNYNSPYSIDANSFFISDSYFTSDTTHTSIKSITYRINRFQTKGGATWDTIRFDYVNMYNSWYYDPMVDDDYQKNEIVGLGAFYELYYGNSSNGAFMRVASRKRFVSQRPSDNQWYIVMENGINWSNSDFRTIYFYVPLSDNTLNQLTDFNNNYIGNGLGEYVSGLTESFSLIRMAYSGVTSLFSIHILPNISLGVLILTPFAITILLFVVKLFKR